MTQAEYDTITASCAIKAAEWFTGLDDKGAESRFAGWRDDKRGNRVRDPIDPMMLAAMMAPGPGYMVRVVGIIDDAGDGLPAVRLEVEKRAATDSKGDGDVRAIDWRPAQLADLGVVVDRGVRYADKLAREGGAL